MLLLRTFSCHREIFLEEEPQRIVSRMTILSTVSVAEAEEHHIVQTD